MTLRKPCVHGRYEAHKEFTMGYDYGVPCPGGEFVAESLNLFGDSPEPYGPEVKAQRKARAEMLRPRRGDKAKVTGFYGANTADNPNGSPPLDWWVIDG